MSVLSLATEHRRAQASLSRVLVTELANVVRALLGATAGREQRAAGLLEVVEPLVHQYGQASAGVAADFYEAARLEVGETGRFDVPLSDPAPTEQIESSIEWALRDLLAPDIETEEAGDEAELIDLDRLDDRRATDLVGASRRLAAQPGRTTLERAIDEDPAAVGWARITDSNPCAFCLMLAGRGFVYLSRETALYAEGTREPYHDHDECTVSPRFRSDRSPLPEVSQRAQDLWYDTAAFFTGPESLRAYERAVRAQRRGQDVRAAVFDGPKADPDRYRNRITHDAKTVAEFRRKAQRGGRNGRPLAERDTPTDPRFPDRG